MRSRSLWTLEWPRHSDIWCRRADCAVACPELSWSGWSQSTLLQQMSKNCPKLYVVHYGPVPLDVFIQKQNVIFCSLYMASQTVKCYISHLSKCHFNPLCCLKCSCVPPPPQFAMLECVWPPGVTESSSESPSVARSGRQSGRRHETHGMVTLRVQRLVTPESK